MWAGGCVRTSFPLEVILSILYWHDSSTDDHGPCVALVDHSNTAEIYGVSRTYPLDDLLVNCVTLCIILTSAFSILYYSPYYKRSTCGRYSHGELPSLGRVISRFSRTHS